MKDVAITLCGLCLGGTAMCGVQRTVAEYDWGTLAKSGQRPEGIVAAVDGRTALRISNTNETSLQTKLLVITNPAISKMQYAIIGEVKHEGVRGGGYFELWNYFPPLRTDMVGIQYFSRTLAESGPMGKLQGTSSWRAFTLPFDRTGTDKAPTRLEINLYLPAQGTVYIGPVKLVEYEEDLPAEPAISPEVEVQTRTVGTIIAQKYFLIERKSSAGDGKPRGLILILPGGPGGEDFLPFCANVLTRYAVPAEFVVVELVAPQWSKDENRVVWPSKAFPDSAAKFTSEEFVAAVIEDVRRLRKIDERYIFTLGWSSSGHVLYAVSLSDPKVRGSIIAMSRFLPARLGNLEHARGKGYFLFHSPDDQICPFRDAQLAERTLKEQGAQVKLVTYSGGHGWVPNTYYCDRIKEGIEWLKSINTK
ncbi:MAG: hypothetical protein C5B50_04310 [Verrucomicrobia bacterium]|nr:MAG: hypothetical protein C5B50_04310 [Verrucomicrobiota bacterium]